MDYAQRRKLQGKETERRILNAALDLMLSLIHISEPTRH